ncbi:MAG: large conductance mechanosensitive channel protein MscL [Ndongobacter sp.]|nr:large conductance mechanosensitive channel protein MscL [Ndongobacter sp.]
MLKEFKDFIARGNVLDMAIGVIIAGAFKAIIDSLVADLLTPLLSGVTGGVNFKDWVVTAGSMQFGVGTFINTIISFLIIAFVMFLIVKAFNRARAKKTPAEKAAPTTKTCPYCKSEINIEATRCPNCTSELHE